MTHPDVLYDDKPAVARSESARGAFPLLGQMYVERGTRADWDLLHELHYKSVGTVPGARYWRCVLDGETIGVVVTGTPKGLLKERHLAFPKLKPGAKETTLTNTYRYKWVNANMRVIARVVVDTMYRGTGVSYRLINLVSRLEGNTFMEIQSSMSKYNLFAQRAGFRFVKPMPSNKYEVGLKFFRLTFESNPADLVAILEELEAMKPAVRERVIRDTRAFYFRHSALEKTGSNRKHGTSRVDAMAVPELIKNLQQMVLASPMYGVFKNPDKGRELPERLPLAAFDRQAPDAPLELD